MSRDSIEVIRMRGAKAAFGESRSSEFGKAAEETPFMIRSLGLGSGVAALAAKGGERFTLAAMVAEWLLKDCPHPPFGNIENPGNAEACVKSLLDKIADGSRSQYRAAQIEAMGFAGWIKRLAQAFCPKEGE